MPGNVILSITVPNGTCYSSPAIDWPLLVSLITANIAGTVSVVNTGSTTPAVADRDKPWLRTNPDGTDDGKWTFFNGFWVQKHQTPQGFIMHAPAGTASTAVDALDGGETAAVTNMTGPFWEIVPELAARSIISPGTLASGTVINSGDSVGEENHQLTVPEMPVHRHEYSVDAGQRVVVAQSTAFLFSLGSGSADFAYADPMDETGGDEAHNTIHPCYALYAIKRTARIYRRRVA